MLIILCFMEQGKFKEIHKGWEGCLESHFREKSCGNLVQWIFQHIKRKYDYLKLITCRHLLEIVFRTIIATPTYVHIGRLKLVDQSSHLPSRAHTLHGHLWHAISPPHFILLILHILIPKFNFPNFQLLNLISKTSIFK